MRGGDAQRYPSYEGEHEQEAARFLATDLDARPVIRGIDDEARLDAWTKVAKEIGAEGRQRRALRQRWQVLNGDDVSADEFQPASDLESAAEVDEPAQEAVADGGAELGTVEEVADGQREIGDGQERMQYEDDAEFESKKNQYRGFVFSQTYDTVEKVEDAIDDEYERDTVRPHILELLRERLEVLTDD